MDEWADTPGRVGCGRNVAVLAVGVFLLGCLVLLAVVLADR